jgi:hypothetical protein
MITNRICGPSSSCVSNVLIRRLIGCCPYPLPMMLPFPLNPMEGIRGNGLWALKHAKSLTRIALIFNENNSSEPLGRIAAAAVRGRNPGRLGEAPDRPMGLSKKRIETLLAADGGCWTMSAIDLGIVMK